MNERSNNAALARPCWVVGADARANLRRVHDNLYVGGAIAVLERPSPWTEWWGVVDVHGPEHNQAFRREAAFGKLAVFLRRGFEDGAPVPDGLLDAVASLIRRRGGPVLISCAMGVSRSASVAYAVIRAETGAGHEAALNAVACPGGRPLPVTLASARAWADVRGANPKVTL